MAQDADLLPLIRTIVDARPTYGYRRVWALLNRKLRVLGCQIAFNPDPFSRPIATPLQRESLGCVFADHASIRIDCGC
jgi:hypothetical protein